VKRQYKDGWIDGSTAAGELLASRMSELSRAIDAALGQNRSLTKELERIQLTLYVLENDRLVVLPPGGE
jgi:hypothetical protein